MMSIDEITVLNVGVISDPGISMNRIDSGQKVSALNF